VEAVVDKDLAAAVLAVGLQERLFIMLTDVECAYLDYGANNQRPLGQVTAAKMQEYLDQGHFAAGSMGPKVEAGLHFLACGGERAIITSTERIDLALEGKAGTQMVR
jgi:carbamate kinase